MDTSKYGECWGMSNELEEKLSLNGILLSECFHRVSECKNEQHIFHKFTWHVLYVVVLLFS